jgi:hypothetical protein
MNTLIGEMPMATITLTNTVVFVAQRIVQEVNPALDMLYVNGIQNYLQWKSTNIR